MYVIYEKSYIDRLGKKINNETNIGDSVSVDGVVKFLENKRKIKIPKRTIYEAIKHNYLLNNKFYIYKIKD